MTQQEINNASMLKVGTILRGTYRIDSYLSSGGFGNTYVATNIEFDERIAIKEFFIKGVTQRDDNQTTVSVSNAENTNSFLEQKEKFKKEARRIRQLKNEHIVAVHDLFEENGTAYYVMDYVDGENLSEHLKRTGRAMTESEVRDILPQILDALKAVHNEGFCHLDIKPSNIMLEKGGKIKLIDFGASKQLGANGTLTTNAPTAFAQTPGYAPREQMEQNLDKIGPWTDIYALGATFYYLLTKNRPPMPSDIDDDESEDKHNALPFPATISNEMKQLVVQMMQTNRMKRPQSIDGIKITHKAGSNTQRKPKAINPEVINEETIVAPKTGNVKANNYKAELPNEDVDQDYQYVELERVGFVDAIIWGLKDKFCYDLSRSRRSEFWWFNLFAFVAFLATNLIGLNANIFGILQLLNLYLFAAMAFLFVRRLHDIGKSGYWWFLIFLVVIAYYLFYIAIFSAIFNDISAGGIQSEIFTSLLVSGICIAPYVYFGCIDSDMGDNEYGESNKYVLESQISETTNEAV